MNYKKLIKAVFMSLALLVVVGCDVDSSATNPSPAFAQLDNDSAVTILENSGQAVEILVLLGGPQATDTQIELDVTGDASRFTLSSSSFSIPAGDTSAVVTLTPVDDDEINGDVQIIVALSSSSSVPVGLVGQGSGRISKTITIVDDNVPCNDYVITVVADRWGSEAMYELLDSDGSVILSGGPFDDLASGTTTETTNITLADGCYTFRVYDWYGDSWSADAASYSVGCGAAVFSGDNSFAGVPGLDINSVPVNPLYGTRFFSGSATSGAAPYANHVDQIEFCVNQ